MALKTGKVSEIPPGHIRLSKREAVNFQLDIMETLCPENRRIFIKYGVFINSMSTAASCGFHHSYYRRALDVIYQGRTMSFVPAILFPGLLNIGLHKLFITENILVQKWACPVCYQLRSSLINLTLGSIYPVIVAPIIAISYARRAKLDVPPLNSKRGIKFLYEKTKPVFGRIGILACINMFIGMAVAEMEARENNDFNKNIDIYIRQYQERMAREKPNNNLADSFP